MASYRNGQLAVLLCAALALAAAALWQLRRPQAPGAAPRQAYAYELAGAVPAPGVYRFGSPQTLGRLLAAAGAQAAAGERTGWVVPNGSRIIAGDPAVIEPLPARDRLNCFLRLSLRTATAGDLQLIPGMGEKTALAIIAYRDGNGGIRDMAELTRIAGIGPKKLERFRTYLTVDE